MRGDGQTTAAVVSTAASALVAEATSLGYSGGAVLQVRTTNTVAGSGFTLFKVC